MPSTNTIESFVQLIGASEIVEAMVRFCAEHASMQENATELRIAKGALIKHEEDALGFN